MLQGVWMEKPKTGNGGRSWAQCLMILMDETEPAKWTQERLDERTPIVRARNITLQESRQQATRASSVTATTNTLQLTPQLTSVPEVGSKQLYEQVVIPDQAEASTTPAKLLTELLKIYNSGTAKYSGEEYDILDQKLQVFYDCCTKIGLSQEHYCTAYSAMLTGRASDFYYDKLSGRSYDFGTMVRLTREHFETEENRQKYLSEWKETNLNRTIMDNPDNSRLDCFQTMVDKLRQIQRGLPSEY
jgi:hypothetical protein